MMRPLLSRRSDGTRRHITRVGLTFAVVVGLVLGGATAASAIWTAQAQVTSTPTAADLTISTTGFSSLNYTYGNEKLSTTGSFTLTNTTATASGQAGSYSATLGYASGGDAALATGLSVRVWPTSDITTCTAAAAVGAGAVSGNWASSVAVSGTLTAGQSASFCVRSTADERGNVATGDGSLGITATISATLTIAGWSETAQATTTQATQHIYPYFSPLASTWYEVRNVSTGNCVDVYQDLTVSGTPLIDYACKAGTNYNQEWMFAPTTGNYFDVISRSASALRWDTVGGSTVTGVPVDVQTDNNVRVSQEWQLQNQGTAYQFVNKLSGMCLQPLDTATTTSVEYAQVTCNGSASQRFTLVLKYTEPPAPVIPVITGPINCTDYGTENGRRITLSWAPNATEAYTVQVRQGATGDWTTVKTIGTGASNVNIDMASGAPLTYPDGTYTLRIVAGTAVTAATPALATRTYWKGTGSAGNYIRCAQPVAAISSVACANNALTGAARSVVYSWAPESTETYSIQFRATTAGSGVAWTQIGQVAGGVSSYAIATGSTLHAVADGTYNIRVVAGTSTAAATAALATSSAWKGTGSASSTYLRCVEPTPVIAAVTCTNTGTGNTNANNNSRVSFSWSEEAIKTYVLQIQSAGGVWTDYGTVAAGATSIALAPASNSATAPFGWATGTYNARITVQAGGAVLATDTFYKAGTGTSQYLRCDQPQLALSCSGTNTLTVGWTGLPTGTYRLQVNNNGWTTVATSSATSGAGNISLAQLTQGDGTYAVRLINAADVQVGSRSVVVETTGFWIFTTTQLVCD